MQPINHYKRQIITKKGISLSLKNCNVIIADRKNYKFFFYKDAPADFFLFEDSTLDRWRDFNEDELLREKFNKDHFSFSFYKIFEPFLHGDLHQFDTRSVSMLS